MAFRLKSSAVIIVSSCFLLRTAQMQMHYNEPELWASSSKMDIHGGDFYEVYFHEMEFHEVSFNEMEFHGVDSAAILPKCFPLFAMRNWNPTTPIFHFNAEQLYFIYLCLMSHQFSSILLNLKGWSHSRANLQEGFYWGRNKVKRSIQWMTKSKGLNM